MKHATRHHRQRHVLRRPSDVLLHLLTTDGVDVIFEYDVQRGTFVADRIGQTITLGQINGPLHLATYNDLKLSQFIAEHGAMRRPGYRWFTVTPRGRGLVMDTVTRRDRAQTRDGMSPGNQRGSTQ